MIKPKSMLIAFIITGILVATPVAVAGCTELQNQPAPKTTDDDLKYWKVNQNGVHTNVEWVDLHDNDKIGVYFLIYKVRIEEDNTTCYVSRSYEGGGISCLKDTP